MAHDRQEVALRLVGRLRHCLGLLCPGARLVRFLPELQRGGVKPGIFHCERCASSQVFGEGDVNVAESAAFFGCHEGHGPKHPPANDHWGDDVRADAELANQVKMFSVPSRAFQRLLAHADRYFRAAGANDARRAERVVAIGWIPLVQFASDRLLVRIRVENCESADVAVVFAEVHDAPGAEVRQGHSRNGGERRFVVERLCEASAGFGEECEAIPAGLGDVALVLGLPSCCHFAGRGGRGAFPVGRTFKAGGVVFYHGVVRGRRSRLVGRWPAGAAARYARTSARS